MQKETQKIFKSPDILTKKMRRLEWIGRVLRNDSERTAKKLLRRKKERKTWISEEG